jgi:hypothetical protein
MKKRWKALESLDTHQFLIQQIVALPKWGLDVYRSLFAVFSIHYRASIGGSTIAGDAFDHSGRQIGVNF